MPEIHLRDLRRDDLPLLRHWMQPEQDWHRWDAPYFPKDTAEQVDAYVDGLAHTLNSLSEPRTAFVIAEDDVLVGQTSWHWEHEPGGWARAGLTVYDPDVRGRGIGTTALARLTDHVFENTHAHRLDYATWSGNEAMCRVGAKLGWSREAVIREAREVRGERYDSVMYGLLRSEWVASRP